VYAPGFAVSVALHIGLFLLLAYWLAFRPVIEISASRRSRPHDGPASEGRAAATSRGEIDGGRQADQPQPIDQSSRW